jgi:hypothetical protein
MSSHGPGAVPAGEQTLRSDGSDEYGDRVRRGPEVTLPRTAEIGADHDTGYVGGWAQRHAAGMYVLYETLGDQPKDNRGPVIRRLGHGGGMAEQAGTKARQRTGSRFSHC